MNNFQSKVGLIWSIAELLRGSWKNYEYQDVILPLTVLKRLDSVLEKTKTQVLSTYNQHHGKINTDPILKDITKVGMYNTSPYDFHRLLDDQSHIAKNLKEYINGFSSNVQQIIEKFKFDGHLSRLQGGNLLYLIISEFNKVDLHPATVSNNEMGYIFEELIRKFSEQSNETAGDHYTPREVIQTMVEVMFKMDEPLLLKDHLIKTIYDPCCGTGGMLSVSKEFIKEHINNKADLYLYGQESNPLTYAICKADMLIKGEDAEKIKGGDEDHSQASTLSTDQFSNLHFDYILANPPYGVDWKKDKEKVEKDAARGHAGRFGAGLPRISDGQLLFLQHMISKMQNPTDGGSRIAVVFNGSPLFTGDAGSGESEIRRWILENDWLEAIVALPDQLFYNTEISTYVWFLTNRKPLDRKDYVQLIDARKFFKKMRKSLGKKRHKISNEDRAHIIKQYSDFKNTKHSKIFKTTDFAFRQITIERPLRLKFDISKENLEKLKERMGLILEPDQEHVELLQQQSEETKGSALLLATKQNLTGHLSLIEGHKLIFSTISLLAGKRYNGRAAFLDAFQRACKSAGIKFAKKELDLFISIFGEKDEEAEICYDSKGNPEPDPELRDTENVPYEQDIYEYFEREVLPFASDAWIDESKVDHKDRQIGRVGYEIPVTRYFYEYTPPRPLEEIEADIEEIENELLSMLKELTK